jgi:hypothetical protein
MGLLDYMGGGGQQQPGGGGGGMGAALGIGDQGNPLAGLTMRAYRDYAEQTMVAGNQPMPFPQWLKMMQARMGQGGALGQQQGAPGGGMPPGGGGMPQG